MLSNWKELLLKRKFLSIDFLLWTLFHADIKFSDQKQKYGFFGLDFFEILKLSNSNRHNHACWDSKFQRNITMAYLQNAEDGKYHLGT